MRSDRKPVCPSSSFSSSSTPPQQSFTDTLLLPTTDFSQRAFAADNEPRLRRKCTDDLYRWHREAFVDAEEWILHDGPPYANGELHMGHFLNKTLKDIINRHKLLQGYRVHYKPGWDCHGLPIENKVLENTALGKVPPAELRTHAAAFANGAVEAQKKEFREWAIMGDWDTPYTTMAASYEAKQLDVFLMMVQKGLIYRGKRPVHWSPSSRTALAEAELEYAMHTSPSVHVAFPLVTVSPALASIVEKYEELSIAIWTTTPWTLPANLAICFAPTEDYCVVKHGQSHLVVAVARVDALSKLLEVDGGMPILDVFSGSGLAGCQARHPFMAGTRPLLAGDHVGMESGTGLVHTAPDHGMEDFAVCNSHGIKSEFSMVNAEGAFTAHAGDTLEGKDIFGEGNATVIELLREAGRLIDHRPYEHRYPFDWRTKQPVILRATDQWFCGLESLQAQALEALQDVHMLPASDRLKTMVAGRKEWCISRQRVWGVPIPVFYDEDGDALLTDSSVRHVQSLFAQHGASCWWSMETNELLAPEYRANGKSYTRGADTMDVWFDSGVSWYAALEPEGLSPPFDLYLEGSDQHRGWFQSSLLTAVASTGKAPYKNIVTHGFVLDENRVKMSKSIGNVIVPSLLIHGGAPPEASVPEVVQEAETDKKSKKKKKKQKKQKKQKELPASGVDVLRVWVASCDYTRDASVGTEAMESARNWVKRFRNSCRFMLGNIHDATDSTLVPYEQLSVLERYMLHELHALEQKVAEAFQEFKIFKVVQLVSASLNSLLSSIYFVAGKDALYTYTADSPERRAVQTVLIHWLEVVTKSVAAFAPHTAEDVYEHLPASLRSVWHRRHARPDHKTPDSIFTTGWASPPAQWHDPSLAAVTEMVLQLRSCVLAALETAKTCGEIPSSLQADLTMHLPEEVVVCLRDCGWQDDDLKRILSLSSVSIVQCAEAELSSSDAVELPNGKKVPVVVAVRPTSLGKCPRCWNYNLPADAPVEPCPKCRSALSKLH